MSRKRFTTAVLAVILLGAIGLVSLYMTLGRVNALLKSRAVQQGSSDSVPAADGRITFDSQNGGKMKLTPIGEAQLRQATGSAQPAGTAQATGTVQAMSARPSGAGVSSAPSAPASSGAPSAGKKPAPVAPPK